MCTESQLFMIESQIVETYRNVFGSDIVEILLYGSYARGDYDSESDIDIAAILHGECSLLQDKLKIVNVQNLEQNLQADFCLLSVLFFSYNNLHLHYISTFLFSVLSHNTCESVRYIAFFKIINFIIGECKFYRFYSTINMCSFGCSDNR